MQRRAFQKLAITSLAALPSCAKKAAIPASMSEQAELIRQGHLNAVDLTQHYLDRIARLDPQIPRGPSFRGTHRDRLG